MMRCHACSKELDIIPPIGRREVCVFCGSDLHCCLNCNFYKMDAYNDCREPQAARVVEKRQSNFCDYFTFKSSPQDNQKKADEKIEDAKMKLEALFKKI
ncbi:hypothetical protein SAMN04489760_1204 [Syntrophus gentianae]|uniref:Uncharacterized protein n=2 Tax=Syntrophus gentianae TaxID=43775 RepID=A0A1H7Z327_9BACT|nr:hypothetical protein SAMN04489760_1204 [Syntrophus gentianae]